MPSECASEHNVNIRPARPRPAWLDAHLARKREQKAMVAARLAVGFVHEDKGQVVAGRRHDDFVEEGLRSPHLGLAGHLFVKGCRKAPNLRGGSSKSVMMDLGTDKILALDAAYIEGNRAMISLIRIDLDMTFPSTDHAIRALEQVVADGDLPCLPHLLVGDVGHARIRSKDEDGHEVETFHSNALIRPHAWIILRDAVNAGPNGRAKPRHTFVGVFRGVCKALLHLGADPLASPFLVRGKNPLSPYLWSMNLNDDIYPDLNQWSDWVDSRVPAETLSRMAAEKRSGLDPKASNTAFTALQTTAFQILRDMHRAGDETYLAAVQDEIDTDAIEDILRERMPLKSMERDPSWSEGAAEKIYEQVVAFASGKWDPAKADRKMTTRGTMLHETGGMTTRAKQSASGKRTAGMKADTALTSLVEAYRAVVATGKKPTKAAVARTAGVDEKTARRRWNEVVGAAV